MPTENTTSSADIKIANQKHRNNSKIFKTNKE